MNKRIKDIKVGDMVLTPEGYKPVVEIIEEHIPNRMFKMTFTNGVVKCSDDHLWVVTYDNIVGVFDTLQIFSSNNKYLFNFGEKNGPKLLNIKEIKPEKVCCIKIDTEDKLFAISLPKGRLFTHNCQFRAACGRLGSIASMMLFGNTMATTIDGGHPGAGMISANGAISSIQYYFEDIKWIQNFYKTCGYDNQGHRILNSNNSIYDEDEDKIEENNKEFNEENSDFDISAELEDLDSIFDFEHDISKIEIQGISGEVDKTKRQKFE